MVVAASKPDPVDVHVGARLRLRRLQVGMNQGALARAIRVTFQQVQKYERGANRLSASRLYAACGVLRVEPGYFFEELRPQKPGRDGAGADEGSPALLMTPQSLELVMLLPEIEPEVRGAILRLARILAKRMVHSPVVEDETP
jgi:transcriptional regulator with XRE-family HTH domain